MNKETKPMRRGKFYVLLSVLLVGLLWSVAQTETVRTFVTTDSAALGQSVDIAIKSYTKAQLDALGAGTAGRLARLTDDNQGVRLDTGTRYRDVGGGKWTIFADDLTDLTKDAARITGRVHSLSTGPSSIDIKSEQANRGTVVWVRPNGTMATDTDSGFIVHIEGEAFVGPDHSYLELGYNEGSPGHFLIANMTEGAGVTRNLRFASGKNRTVMEFAKIDNSVSGGTWRVDQHRNWFAADLNDPDGPATDQGTVRLSRTRRTTALQTGLTWSLQFSPFAFDGASQVQRNIDIQGIGAIGTDSSAAYYLEARNNASTPFLRLVPLVNNSGFATLWLDPPDETIPASVTNPIPAINLNPTTYTLAGNVTQFSQIAFQRAQLTAGVARTVTDGVTLYVEGPPESLGSVTQTRSYGIWLDTGQFRWDDPIALGGGATATLGTIGGSGPATAGQNQWLRVNINGTVNFIPVWQ